MRSLAAVLLLVAAPAVAQDQGRPDIVRGLCQKDGCDEFSILKVDRVRGDEEGTLFRTRIRTYHSSNQGRAEKGVDTGYVFCSPTKPTILAESDGKIAGFQIATAPSQESRETIRQQSNFYAIYFTICHGPEAGRAAVQDMEGVARQFGYRSPLAKSVMVTFANPDEVFSRAVRNAEREVGQDRAVRNPERDIDRDRAVRSAERDVDRDGDILDRRRWDSRNGDPVPPRAIPETREGPWRNERFAERRWDDRPVERRIIERGDDVVIIEKRRPAAEARPWYREPERWIESINPF